MKRYVQSDPYQWPYNGDLQPENTALIIIDMQVDFCGKGGYVDQMGYDLELTRSPIAPIKKVLDACRKSGFHIIHTREGHRPDLSDLPPNKQWRSKQIGAGIGDMGPCGRVLTRGQPGWDIIPELAPIEGEPIIDKPGKGSFYATDLDLVLRLKGVKNIILAGITTDVCVHTTMRDANDKGYECLLLTDGTGATDPGNHAAAIKMVQMQGGVFGAVATADAFLSALEPPVPKLKAAVAAGEPSEGGEGVVVVAAEPYEYPLPVKQAALIMIDFQKDFLEVGGFATALGNNVEPLQACLEPAARLLAACRKAGMSIVHTMEAHKSDLSDLHVSKWKRGNPPVELRIGEEGDIGGRILIQGEPANGIVDAVAPIEGELQLHKPGKGSFYATHLEEWLRARGITHLLFAGVTTEVCVQTSMREANDRGFESLLVTDATESFFPEFKAAVIKMTISQGGIVGWTADAAAVEKALAGAS